MEADFSQTLASQVHTMVSPIPDGWQADAHGERSLRGPVTDWNHEELAADLSSTRQVVL